MRLSNAEPELRNDIYLGDALPLDGATAGFQWEDAELFKGIGGDAAGLLPAR